MLSDWIWNRWKSRSKDYFIAVNLHFLIHCHYSICEVFPSTLLGLNGNFMCCCYQYNHLNIKSRISNFICEFSMLKWGTFHIKKLHPLDSWDCNIDFSILSLDSQKSYQFARPQTIASHPPFRSQQKSQSNNFLEKTNETA
jgi:hypothetical protein